MAEKQMKRRIVWICLSPETFARLERIAKAEEFATKAFHRTARGVWIRVDERIYKMLRRDYSPIMDRAVRLLLDSRDEHSSRIH